MGINQLNNTKSHNRIQSGVEKCYKALWGNGLHRLFLFLWSLAHRETLVSHFLSMIYIGKIAVLFLSNPSTFCRNNVKRKDAAYPVMGVHGNPKVTSNSDTQKTIMTERNQTSLTGIMDLTGRLKGVDNPMRFDYDTVRNPFRILKKRMKKPITILFSCIGRRVSLVNAFRDAARRLRTPLNILGVDASPLSPALQLCDQAFLVPPVNEDGYLRDMLRIIRDCRVEMLIPTVDLDLKILAANRGRFERLGCRVLVSRPEVIAICQDKRKAGEYWLKNRFDTPKTMSVASALRSRKLEYPRFLKPWDGYASRGNAVAHNREELAFYGRRIPNCIVQELIRGEEFTCDAFVDRHMQVRCVVPRRRLEVRSGEVSKARIVRDPVIMEQVARLVTVLGAGPGVITIQLIRRPDGTLKFIEVNPRFGGGAPLSIRAGADFPRWLLQELLGQTPRIRFDGFEDGLLMLRYDEEVWVHSTGGRPR